MTTTEMINAIRNKSAENNALADEKARKIFSKNMKYIDLAKELIQEHSKDLMRVVDELQKNGFYLLTKSEESVGIHESKWVSNGISHRVGFITTTPKYYYNGKLDIVGFGIINGGCCGNVDLVFDFEGNLLKQGQVFSDGRMDTLYRFVENFEDFVDEFYGYVERTYLKQF